MLSKIELEHTKEMLEKKLELTKRELEIIEEIQVFETFKSFFENTENIQYEDSQIHMWHPEEENKDRFGSVKCFKSKMACVDITDPNKPLVMHYCTHEKTMDSNISLPESFFVLNMYGKVLYSYVFEGSPDLTQDHDEIIESIIECCENAIEDFYNERENLGASV